MTPLERYGYTNYWRLSAISRLRGIVRTLREGEIIDQTFIDESLGATSEPFAEVMRDVSEFERWHRKGSTQPPVDHPPQPQPDTTDDHE